MGFSQNCTGRVKLRDDDGALLRDESGEVQTRPCGNKAMVGLQVCGSHGGRTKAAKKKSTEARVEKVYLGRIHKLLDECDLGRQHPIEGLLEVVQHSGAMMRVLRNEVAKLGVEPDWDIITLGHDDEGNIMQRLWPKSLLGWDKDGEQASNILLKMYGEWTDRHMRACKLALDAGVAERTIRVAERQAEMLATLLQSILGRLGLTDEQKAIAPQIVREELLQLSSTTRSAAA